MAIRATASGNVRITGLDAPSKLWLFAAALFVFVLASLLLVIFSSTRHRMDGLSWIAFLALVVIALYSAIVRAHRALHQTSIATLSRTPAHIRLNNSCLLHADAVALVVEEIPLNRVENTYKVGIKDRSGAVRFFVWFVAQQQAIRAEGLLGRELDLPVQRIRSSWRYPPSGVRRFTLWRTCGERMDPSV